MLHRVIRRLFPFLVTLTALLSLAHPAAAAPFEPATVATYRLTIENLARKQAFSPPLVVVHSANYHLFHVGARASDGLRLIAEEGNTGVAVRATRVSKGIVTVQATRSVIAPGKSLTIHFRASPGSLLSLATMLEQTNDGFTGVDASSLPVQGARTTSLVAYDAGTEANNELATHVPGTPFAGFRRAPTSKPITRHAGIQGVGDLKASAWNWQNPVALLTIERVR